MTGLNVKFLAVQGTPESAFESAGKRIEKLFGSQNFSIVEKDPDILYFLSGGTERMAINLANAGHFYLLLGSRHNNSYASAVEVKAYLNGKKIPSLLLDEEETSTSIVFNNLLSVKKAINKLKGKKLGLIGSVSDWLVSSEIPADTLLKKLGIELSVIPWNELKHFSEFNVSESFLETYSAVKNTDLTETAKVHEFLSHTIHGNKLDAITVECFPMVKNYNITACLSLAKFNNEGVAAGCEGDLTAVAGMMLCKELTGTIPWIANINKATEDVCMFSHCTIAPGLVSEYSVDTHFETGVGTAIQGNFKSNTVTIFRFDNLLSKAFIATSSITARPKLDTACRTQIEVKLSENEVRLLRHHPLGNHHLIYPGDCKMMLEFACNCLGIEMQK